MFETRYKEVRKLLRDNKIVAAEKIHTGLASSAEKLSIAEKFWLKLIASEIKRKKKNYQSARDDIEEAFLLSKEIKLDDKQKSSLHGRMAIVQYKLKEYEIAVSFFHQTLSLLRNDLGRQNYYRKMLCSCYIELEDDENFSHVLKAAISDIVQGQIREYWDSNLDFAWDITQLARNSPWNEIVEQILNLEFQQLKDDYIRGYIAYFRARVARQKLDRNAFLKHMQESLRICSTIDLGNFISLCLSFIGMLQLFGEYRRAKNLLVQCLKKVPKPSPLRINILNHLGSILRFSGEYELSIKFLNESLEINQTIQDVWQEAYTHNTLGMVYTLIGNVDKATEHYNSSLELSKITEDYNGLGFTYGALGWLESNQGNLLPAKKWYETSISIFEEQANSTPAIILLAYAEILSKMGDAYSKEIKEICDKARKIIWAQQKRLDYGRYYNTLGNIALNQRNFEQALREFSLALEYSDSFEVETQTLLGIIKTNLELFLESPDEFEYLDKVRLFLNDLKTAAESSAFISGEIDLIMGIIEMHSQNYQKAVDKFAQVLKHAQDHNYNLLVEKVRKQREILQILQTHDQLQKVTSMTDHELKRTSIREAITYLTGLIKLINTQTKESKP